MAAQFATPQMEFCGLSFDCYAYMFYNWQTLIGGLIAIGAALYAGKYVKKQIAISEKMENDRLARRARAVRAILPLTLTKFIDFAEACADVTRRVRGPVFGPAPAGSDPIIIAPQLPLDAIRDLERAIEATSNELAVQIMTRLAGHSQVLHSIITDMVTDVNARGNSLRRVDPNWPAFQTRTARVHAAASRLFSWARGETQAPGKVNWDHLESSLVLMNLEDEATSAFINRRREQNAEPLGW